MPPSQFCYLLQRSNGSLVVLGKLESCCHFGRVGDNFCIQLPTFLHQSLLTFMRLLQRLMQLFVLHPEFLQTPISHQLCQSLQEKFDAGIKIFVNKKTNN